MRSLREVDQAASSYYFTAQQTGIDNKCRERMIRRCLPYLRPDGDVLELGFMDGQWTDHFLESGCSVVAVEGALKNVEFGRSKYRDESRVTMVHSLFDDYVPSQKFDLIHMGGMLKHLDNPRGLLQRAIGWLKPDGILFATTPNARSLHRRVGVHMGLLTDLTDLSETDKAVGNLRHYDLPSFRQLIESSGFEIIEIATAVVKPVSSDRMSDWPDDLLDALDKIASEIPDYGWYIYSISRPA
jgi:2-polyprenyl-3-methyl-5-hydroxy-6-metoxy-1,4-benzoquinol methylase